ncbi:MAG TPA: hypothetical protein VE998_12550 [Terriglobales bacterium]|nr:hypothetical protein [Terriglobales bacterium]
MAEPFRCMQCELPEERCACQKYCNWCMSEHDVRLCFDGLFYCLDCREAGDLSVQNRVT